MSGFIASRPLFKIGLLALLTLPFLFLINHYSPSKEKVPSGYSSSILAFEFASTKAEVAQVLDPLSKLEIKNLDKLNYVDFGFMLIYGAFLFFFMTSLGGLLNNDLTLKARWLVPVIVLSDVMENIQLLKLTEKFSIGAFETSGIISVLMVATWIKWLLLAVCFSIIGFQLSKLNVFSKIMGCLLFIPLVLGVMGFSSKNRIIEDAFATGVFLSFFFIFIYCLTFKKALST